MDAGGADDPTSVTKASRIVKDGYGVQTPKEIEESKVLQVAPLHYLVTVVEDDEI